MCLSLVPLENTDFRSLLHDRNVKLLSGSECEECLSACGLCFQNSAFFLFLFWAQEEPALHDWLPTLQMQLTKMSLPQHYAHIAQRASFFLYLISNPSGIFL